MNNVFDHLGNTLKQESRISNLNINRLVPLQLARSSISSKQTRRKILGSCIQTNELVSEKDYSLIPRLRIEPVQVCHTRDCVER